MSRERPYLVQPYLETVMGGEVSLFFFGGVFSHAVTKRPAAGDYRVQEMFGGVATSHQPTAAERELAGAVLSAAATSAASELLYARVDLLAAADGHPLLMEVEAIEPFLFFAQAPGAEEALVAALLAAGNL